jgi:hypothetical protein
MNRKALTLVAFLGGALAVFAQGGRARALPAAAAGPSAAVPSAAKAADPVALEHAMRAHQMTLGLDYDDARRELSQADENDPAIQLERGRIALYEAECDTAAQLFARPDVAQTEAGAGLGDIARGCARVTAALAGDVDRQNGVEIRYQDEADRAMTPLLVETVVKARDALTRDLGVSWPSPTRIIVVRDLLSLSAMTGLPYKSAQTTGTVAVAKWGRVTLLSPRASHHGYAWRDTMAHELTHLAVTRASQDRAPLWLQEGVAKREEVRWREPGPFDDRPSPDAIVTRGTELGLAIPLDKLGPSIAMLPSADAAMVAFAEVTSFVRYFASTAGPEALPKLLAELRAGKAPDVALRDASGADLKAWDTRWRAYLAAKPREAIPALFGLGGEPPDVRDLRDRTRLAELLVGRDHAPEALLELDRIKTPGALDDSSVRYLRARTLEALGRGKDAEPLVANAKDVLSPYAPWWAIRGRFARLRGDDAVADPSFYEAVAIDPLDVESACEGIDRESRPKDPRQGPLCDAARAREEPGLGRE